MQPEQRNFLQLAIEHGVLRFGDFELKSGRMSPYFFNAGLFNTGAAMAALGRHYARTLVASRLKVDMMFGPAYKGIPLVTATAIALADEHGQSLPFAYNRKEAKQHGEGGATVGAPVEGRVLIVDDVITAGTAIREAVEIIRAAGAEPAGVLIALDRQERGTGEKSAVDEMAESLELPVHSIVKLLDLIALLAQEPGHEANLAKLEAYRARYGVAPDE